MTDVGCSHHSGTSRNFIVATAGHVDHGKSTLVKALTGTDPDRLPEERARGISIDLGFAHLRLADERGGALNVGIVDVPGHEDFVKNMVAGVGAIDLALLVVAADDGWMPQTEEHVQILAYLGVARAVIALTKIDRLEGKSDALLRAMIREKLNGLPFSPAPIIATSVLSGAGIGELAKSIRDGLAGAPPRRDHGKPRLWVDRAFSLRGVGTIVTGTLTGGTFAAGQAAVVAPRGTPTHLRSIQNHGREQQIAFAGTRTALNLVGVTAGSAEHNAGSHVARGDLVTTGDIAPPHATCDVWLERSARPAALAARPLQHATAARLHIGTAAVGCRVILPRGGALHAGESTSAQLRLDQPLALVCGERFVLRDHAERATIAGGVVLDPEAERGRFHRPEQQDFLRRQLTALAGPDALILARLRRDAFVPRAALGLRWPFSSHAVAAALTRHLAGQTVASVGECVSLTERWRELLARAEAAIAAHHTAHPTQNGLPAAQLRAMLGRDCAPPEVSNAVIDALLNRGYELNGAALRRRDFRPRVPASLESAALQVERLLLAGGLNPPGRPDVAPDAARRDALDFLLKTGKAVALGESVVLASEHLVAARRRVREILAERGHATVSELRQALGTSRRIMVPLLERLDREGITLRQGEVRVPGRNNAAAPTSDRELAGI